MIWTIVAALALLLGWLAVLGARAWNRYQQLRALRRLYPNNRQGRRRMVRDETRTLRRRMYSMTRPTNRGRKRFMRLMYKMRAPTHRSLWS